jgi:hypothetical protein
MLVRTWLSVRSVAVVPLVESSPESTPAHWIRVPVTLVQPTQAMLLELTWS